MLLFAAFTVRCSNNSELSTAKIDWKSFLASQDIVWDSIRTGYYTGAIMGNGLLGANFYKTSDSSYRFDIGRTDITENRGIIPDYKRSHLLFDEARLPIGYFTMKPVGNTYSDSMRLSLYNAMTKAYIITDKGNISFDTYVHSDKNIIILDCETTGNEADFEWTFTPSQAISPRFHVRGDGEVKNSDYLKYPNPAVEAINEGDYHFSVQPLYCGLTYVVAWKDISSGSNRRIAITISQENLTDSAIAVAKRSLDEYFAEKSENFEESHCRWWHNYYPASYATFGDKALESFYWRQVYKLACATRPDKLIIDLQGPWTVDDTPWPAIWFNLNTQLTYSWQVIANRQDMTKPVWKLLNDNIATLHNNVIIPDAEDAIGIGRSASYSLYSRLNPKNADLNQYEVGNMTWLLYYYFQYCTYNNYTEELTNKFYPLLKAAINYYFHIRYLDNDGKYHLLPTASPEYTSENPGNDVNYDLALLHWGLETLLKIDRKYGLKDEKEADWQDFIDNLTDYPKDEYGFRISSKLGFDRSHRHYSHLLMVYPLYLVNWEQPENKELITRSIDRWMSLQGALQGYSFTGSSSMYASMGDGERAVKQLQTLLDKYIQFNTLYRESGPVFETPMAAVASLQDLYIQSWGGKIRIFPAVPVSWTDIEFIDFRADGAFLVSAKRENGINTLIQIKSEAGGNCQIQTGIDLKKMTIKSLKNREIPYSIIDSETGLIEFNTEKGDMIQIKQVK